MIGKIESKAESNILTNNQQNGFKRNPTQRGSENDNCFVATSQLQVSQPSGMVQFSELGDLLSPHALSAQSIVTVNCYVQMPSVLISLEVSPRILCTLGKFGSTTPISLGFNSSSRRNLSLELFPLFIFSLIRINNWDQKL